MGKRVRLPMAPRILMATRPRKVDPRPGRRTVSAADADGLRPAHLDRQSGLVLNGVARNV